MTVYECRHPIRETLTWAKWKSIAGHGQKLNRQNFSERPEISLADLGGHAKRVATGAGLESPIRRLSFLTNPPRGWTLRKNAILSMLPNIIKNSFTAILVSHEIPDIFFISNRIPRLYNRTIVFKARRRNSKP